MEEKIYRTSKGDIHYWFSDSGTKYTLVFLPGLSADHRLFNKQIEYFEGKISLLVWDAPGHNLSRPFELNFKLQDKAVWLNEILKTEKISDPVIIGQSMGGYVGQCYAEYFPGKMKGFISIDSAPLQKQYVTDIEIWLLMHIEPVYKIYPWKPLLKAAVEGVAESAYGRDLMKEITSTYDKDYYVRLAGHGYYMLGEAMKADLKYELDCPSLLICGKKDKAASTKRYNLAWHKKSGIRLELIADAGHNSNTDAPETVNGLIENFIFDLN